MLSDSATFLENGQKEVFCDPEQ